MKSVKVLYVAAWASGVFSAVPGSGLCAGLAAPEAQSVAEAISGGKLLLQLRPRWEYVDQDGRAENADAFTMRTLLGWETASFHHFSVTAQVINVSRLGNKDYNDNAAAAAAAASRFPLVADPHDTDMNQLFVDWTGLSDTKLRVGKQSIKIDNVRFIGNVDFRQIQQVFEGGLLENRSIPNTDLLLGHLSRAKSATTGLERTLRVELAHADWHWTPTDHAIAYGYFQDDPRYAAAAANVADISNRIEGVRLDGNHALADPWGVVYTFEFAKQKDYKNGSAAIDAKYEHIGLGPRYGSWYLRADFELLGSNRGNYAFQTPLGTNHLFQGWVDQFLTTPKQGLKDKYLMLGGKIGDAQILSEYHRYKADFGTIDFGKEFDVSVAYPLMKQLTGKIEYGDYKAGDAAGGKRDTSKIWLTLVFNY